MESLEKSNQQEEYSDSLKEDSIHKKNKELGDYLSETSVSNCKDIKSGRYLRKENKAVDDEEQDITDKRYNECQSVTSKKRYCVDERNSRLKYYFAVIAVIILMISICSYRTENIAFTQDNAILFKQALNNLKKEFPSQTIKFWSSVHNLVKYVSKSKPTRPAIAILLHNNSASAECLAWEVGKAASNFLNTPGIIELPAEEAIKYQDNELVVKYKQRLEKNAVMVVYRLDEISGLVARSFHTFCDTYNPLVSRAVILFTMKNNYVDIDANTNPAKQAAEILKSLWKGELVDSALHSLITRLTDNVLEVNPEQNISCEIDRK